MATRKDVAEYAGVSVATVSYVMNGTKHVTPEVKARVEEAIRKLNYTPNLVARSLVTRKTQHIAMLVNNLKNPYYSEMLAGAQYVAGKAGYIVSIILVDYSNPRENIQLAARGVDGAILLTISGEGIEEYLHEKSIPTVSAVFERKTSDLENHSAADVWIDYSRGIFDAVKSLKKHGHKKVAYLSGLKFSEKNNERYGLLRAAMEHYGIPLYEKLMVEGSRNEETDEEAGMQAMRTLLERKEPFTAVITVNDLMAVGAMRELKKHGICVPEDVSMIGCDNIQIGQYFYPSISTVDIKPFETGKCMAKALIEKIEHKPATGRKVSSAYIERESVGDCKEGWQGT